MRRWGSCARAFRRGYRASGRKRRAVSPIIATILLVAIAVVLAAVLYVMVEGLARGPTDLPLSTALALGPASPTSGSKSTSTYCATGHGCYSVSIASASSSLTAGDLEFTLKSASGSDHVVLKGSGQFSIVSLKGTVIARSPSVPAGKPLVATSWVFAKGYSSASVMSTLYTIWVEFGTGTPSPAGHGFVLEAIGVGPYDGNVLLSLP